ncbi:3-hydroxybutyryl-CoA dehydrogenase [Vibrio harveyi]|uniref:3-hydroxyacyl-CoA dehydrogenase family protein n=1 Tax=Vibrio harveyi TaxID=669 RepID=UPI000C7E0738|nr:3-hydroxyacyl-CoA dehydrogenase NAD-binding domain-containing protein [Vibrio harveyi]AWA98065.1 3-hydroxybutyryl-CoA dehydrogenase [Vibrio harveyi]
MSLHLKGDTAEFVKLFGLSPESISIAVIGAGVMGTGVAHDLARHGFNTIVVDNDQNQLDTCASLINRNLRLYQVHEVHGKLTNSRQVILERLKFTTDLNQISDVSIVIENVTENWDIKQSLYQQMREICRPDTIFCVNTSAISITRVASLMPRPENVVGVHFMNPVPLKPMVELIRGMLSNEHALECIRELLAQLNKETITVEDSPGFVTNRAMMIFVNEAIFMVQENVASAADVDTLFKTCFGHKMGPLQTADLIGLDTILQSLEVLYEGFNDCKFRPCFLLKKMVSSGKLGMKSGSGFYEYNS